MDVKLVILGHSYSSRLGLIRSVSGMGYSIDIIVMEGRRSKRQRRPIDAYSKYVSRVFFCPRYDKEALSRLLKAQYANKDQHVVFIPDSDETASAFDFLGKDFCGQIYYPHILSTKGTVSAWMDKSRQKELARSLGINVASATKVEIVDGKYAIPDSIRFPCFVKPLATINGGKGGMRRCDSKKELAASLDFIIEKRSKNESVLVEDYLNIDKEYALVGLSDGDSVLIPSVMHLTTISKNSPGIALQGKVLSPLGFEGILDKFRLFVKSMGFVGLFDIDFFLCGEEYFFGEMNLRFGGSGYAVTKMGVNLPKLMVDSFLGNINHLPTVSISGEATFTNDRMCLSDWEAGHISYQSLRHYLLDTDIRFIPDDKDSVPEIFYDFKILSIYIRKVLKSIIKRFVFA